jgi:hypothetical protein
MTLCINTFVCELAAACVVPAAEVGFAFEGSEVSGLDLPAGFAVAPEGEAVVAESGLVASVLMSAGGLEQAVKRRRLRKSPGKECLASTVVLPIWAAN